jgi:hypothetical protein
MNKVLYKYHGNVKQFGSIIVRDFDGQTLATSEKQALNNLSYQIKRILKLSPNAKVILDSKYLSC